MKRLVGLLCIAGLAGCSDPQLGQLDQTLAEIRRTADGKAPEVVEELSTYQSLDYRFSDARSPFLAPEDVRENVLQVEQAVSEFAPEQQRAQEPLERFQLQALRLVGTLRMGEQQVALIEPPEGEVVSVREGDYLGTNHGLINQIESQGITIIERVFSPQQGWQQRQVTLTLEE
ncbi:pilus assembly protein PilP [Vreelandella alkaliphila]|uniref:Pilus assembly protein PilP n=1 Tax=Vreelandella alkaliphila TaxID=272774 RepID=A0ABX4HN56_9GAMM|nr:pilus assembly protein PilP [Halomonas humidisoli]PAU73594.1 pilus assembly protein PilP [Halomonas humidisoli]